jgi:hypothetical protein
MIKMAVIAVLVAGSVGFIWTAPWKDEVDSVRASISSAAKVIDTATSGDCAKVAAVAGDNVKSAVNEITDTAPSDTSAKTAAKRQADQIAACIKRLPKTGAGWRDLERKLRQAAG